jgi:mRNA interferase MazF
VLTRDEAIPALKNVVVATVSKTIRDIPSEIRLTEADGMPNECAISLDNLRTVPRALLTGRIATLRPNRIDELCKALDASAGC